METTKTLKRILVVGGGGMKGFMYLGALKAFYDRKMLNNIEIFAGTSIGGIIVSLMVIGYTLEELFFFGSYFEFERLIPADDSIRAFQYMTGSCMGLYDDTRTNELITKLIERKINPNITLGELYEKTQRKLILTGTCVSSGSCCYLSHETFPNMPLCTAIKITSRIPFIFEPIVYNNKLYVDGGCMDGFPVHLFDDVIDEVIGIYVDSVHGNYSDDCNDILSYHMSIMKCIGNSKILSRGYDESCLFIKTKPTMVTDFKLSERDKLEMFKFGYSSCVEFIEKNMKINNGIKYEDGDYVFEEIDGVMTLKTKVLRKRRKNAEKVS